MRADNGRIKGNLNERTKQFALNIIDLYSLLPRRRVAQVRIPDQIGHLFRSKPATHSGPIRPPFRSKSATPWISLN